MLTPPASNLNERAFARERLRRVLTGSAVVVIIMLLDAGARFLLVPTRARTASYVFLWGLEIPVTLTALPNGGQAFTGWSGDTTTSNGALVLPMGRPYSVTANFTGAVAVSYSQATNGILGLGGLTPQQSTYLDLVGNNNGSYDLGDYLAYLKANGFVLSADVLARMPMTRVTPTTPER